MFEKETLKATVEITIAQLSNSEPLLPCEKTGKEVGEMIKSIYDALYSITNPTSSK